jgi:hypothetical protein
MVLIFLIGVSAMLSAQLTLSGYPYLAYSSETRWMGGAFTFTRYDFSKPFTEPNPHRISLLGNTIYSQNKQFMLALIPSYELGAFSLDSSMQFSSWPDTFYGTGNFTAPDEWEAFTSSYYATETSLSYRLGRSLSASLQMDLGLHKLKEVEESGMLENAQIPGKEDAVHSGIGASLRFDSSDGGFYPTRGLKFELKQLWYEADLGSDHTWQKNLYDFRLYVPLSSKSVFATQSDLELNRGDVPFYRYPELGNRLRAYDSKRFIDKVRISQRVENRLFPFEDGAWTRLGFVLFAETGQVAPELQDIALKDWHLSLGGGIRFSILPKERLNLRADFGFGSDSFNFIINAREVF